jgi:pantetheine-phosphate adenylyltransferase
MPQIKIRNNDKIPHTNMINKSLYNTLALGGTFDHLHDGHKDFLKFAAEISKYLIIGVTDSQMTLQKQDVNLIQPTHIRKQALVNFCKRNEIDAKVITIFDPFGPTLEKSKIQALACTQDTLAGADKINEYRDKLHLRELPIHIHKLKSDVLELGTISSERIRAGEIDREGNIYSTVLENSIKLNEDMRKFFSLIQGEVVTKPSYTKNVNALKIIVGDTTLETFIKNDWEYDLGIYDGKCNREEYLSETLDNLEYTQNTENKAGWIEQSATQKITNWSENKEFKHLFVTGEEDLTAVIAVILLPLGTHIYYGQPNTGMVETIVTEKLKETFYSILNQG